MKGVGYDWQDLVLMLFLMAVAFAAGAVWQHEPKNPKAAKWEALQQAQAAYMEVKDK